MSESSEEAWEGWSSQLHLGSTLNRRPPVWTGLLNIKIFLIGPHLQVDVMLLLKSVTISHAFSCDTCGWCTLIRLSIMMGMLGYIYLYPSVTLLAYCFLIIIIIKYLHARLFGWLVADNCSGIFCASSVTTMLNWALYCNSVQLALITVYGGRVTDLCQYTLTIGHDDWWLHASTTNDDLSTIPSNQFHSKILG